ncbi:DUF1592 domain-containing protein [Planctopirus hydrillae]|nr:DUF1592 domain-containing protein [Planctopirus hydrillae]
MRCIDFDDFCNNRMLMTFSQACLRREVISQPCRLHLWMLIVGFGLFTSMTHAADPVAFDRDAKPYLKKYCFSCHDDKKMEGELNLAVYKEPQRVLESLPKWETIIQRVKAKEMPPEGSPQPSEEEFQRFLSWYGTLPRPENECRNLATDATQNFYQGYVMSRRLTRAEYANSVRDLFNYDFQILPRIPADGAGGEGFDTNGSSLFTSAILAEKYLDVATDVASQLLPENLREQPATMKPGEGSPSTNPLETARHKLLAHWPGAGLTPREAARLNLEPFVKRAYRRPIHKEDLEPLLALFDQASQRGDPFPQAMRLPLMAILISPHFLFLAEPEPSQEGVHALPPYPLASRLSYFLWSSLPDDELLQLAESGQLLQDDVLKAQVRRMLADPRVRGLGENFGMQWLGLSQFGETTRPDAKLFPEFDRDLLEAMRQESIETLTEVFRKNRSLRDLLVADYVFVNDRLAEHYGLPKPGSNTMVQVSLTDDQKYRGGLVTQGAVMVHTSYPFRTSPVLRGRWVLEEVLGSKVPPPPPGVPPLPEHDPNAPPLSLRERLEKHRQDPACAACHNRMDPLGFGLENFDVLGRFRTTEAGLAIDASGKLPSGENFSGPAEMKQILLKRKGEFLRNLTKKMLGYALGRGLNKFDQCVIKETLEALKSHDDKSGVLVEQIVLSYPFRHRYTKK